MAGYSRMVYFEIIQYDRLSLIQYGIMWRNQTKEYSHYLVKFDDGGLLIVPRSRILEEGRIAENGKYKVQYNKPEDVSDAVIIKTGDYLTLSRLKREMGQKKKDEHQKNPSTIPTPKRTLTTSRLPQPKRKKMASVIRRTTLESFSSNDPRDLSISNVSSSSYSTSSTPESVFQASSRIPVPVRVTVPRDVESPSTSEEQSLLQALPDLQDCEITCRQLFRTPNRNRQKTLSAVERYMKTMNKKQHELQLEVKGLRQELKDMNNLVLLILQRLPLMARDKISRYHQYLVPSPPHRRCQRLKLTHQNLVISHRNFVFLLKI
ncbi:uncharacterized protein LOC126821182 [Patella vulgata]|uniref:uncharacterized protein LOC126821182 n=1 Tax=Patella vulgata TaxID=6465 RepID=UPI0024A7C034|nr:uncharacterized protein LOC126821182 [Patella vulgata]